MATTPTVDTDGETKEISVTEALREAMHEEMARDEDVFLQGIDVADRGGSFSVSEGLLDEFGPTRVRDTPISESAIVGTGLGAAAAGMRPVVEIMYSDFMGVAFDQIMNQVALMRYMFGGKLDIPLTIRTVDGGGFSAAAQHSKTLHSLAMHLSGIRVVAVSTPYDAKGLLKSAIRHDDPVFFFEHANVFNKTGEVPVEEYTIPLGEAAVLEEGEDVTVVATQAMLYEAMDAMEELEGEVDIELISPRTLDPLDIDTIAASVDKTGRAVVVDETPLMAGAQGEIAAQINEEAFWRLDAPVERVGVPNVPIPFSPPLEQEVIPHSGDIVTAIRNTL
ncbi:alpha-ketoacid dehydrogenase subunit beta [Saliphagus sp. GCM10025334]